MARCATWARATGPPQAQAPPEGLPQISGMTHSAIIMRFSVLLLAAASCLSAQVKFTPHKSDGAVDAVEVMIDGKPFTTFQYGAAVAKPFLAPVRSASGKIVTRGFPMEEIPGESRDHVHHTGLWFSFDDVN